MAESPNPFRLDDFTIANPVGRLLFRLLRRPLSSLLKLNVLAGWHDAARCGPEDEFLTRLFSHIDLTYEIAGGSLDAIPETGPVIIVSNHPFGMIEGCIVIELLRKRRNDVKVMANFLLERILELRKWFIFVDPFETAEAQRRNIHPLKETLRWLDVGHALAIFPAGTVSHFHLSRQEISDPPWSPLVGRIIRKSGAHVLPIFFEGANGWLFQAAGMIHPRVRTLLLGRQLANKRGAHIRIKIGKLIPAAKLSAFNSDEKLLAYLRLRTYLLSDKNISPKTTVVAGGRILEPLVDSEDPLDLIQEISRLPPHQLLLQNDEFEVYHARAPQIPHVLNEIGRLRELTFRLVHEGTGRSTDLDRFDSYYTHLFVWNSERSEIVGAYRLGRVDRIFRRLGKTGLYTSTLFNYHDKVVKQLLHAIELGRSFVRPEYQRSYSALLLLWKGIGQLIVRYPRYHTVFGPVSINSEYESITRQLIINFLKANNFRPELARLIKAKNPLPRRPIRGLEEGVASVVAEDIHEVDELVAEIEANQKNVPVLLRQYLKLGGKLIGFNVDESFGGVLDGLILIDLRETEPKLLERYLGKDGYERFTTYWRGGGTNP